MKTLLVTGATSGLGLEIAKLASKNHKVIACGRNTDVLQMLAKKHGCAVIQGDINNWTWGEPPTTRTIAREIECYKVDAAVCCAGVRHTAKLMENTDIDIAHTLNTNLVSTVMVLQRVIRQMVCQGHGTIAVINSLAGKQGNTEEAVYCASKFGLRGYVESVRYECAKNGVRIFSVYPGAMQTPMTLDRKDRDKLLKPKSVAKLLVDICFRYTDMRLDDLEIMRTTY